MQQSPIEFLADTIGASISAANAERLEDKRFDFLTKPVLQITKKNPKGGPVRLGPSGATFLASKKDSILIAPVVGVSDTESFRVIQYAKPSKKVAIGRWLWTVEAPFIFAEQNKSFVGTNLRISQSLRGGIFCQPNGISAFDLVMCRELATRLIEGGATKKYIEMQQQTCKLIDTPHDQAGVAGMVNDINKKRNKLYEKYPVLKEVSLPWIGTMESIVLDYLIAANEFKYQENKHA